MTYEGKPTAETSPRVGGTAAAAERVGPAAHERIEKHVWVISGVVILGMIMSILDTTIVNVALRTLGEDLHSSISQIQWVVTGYLLSLAAVIPVTGWAARRYGAKRVYMVSLVLFTVGSGLCAIASSTTTLVLFRVLQGAGGGMIMPVGQLIMAQVAGPKRMGRVMGVVSMPAMLAPILGPVVGGAILQHLHWSWIFLVNLPVGVLAFALAWRMLPHTDSGEAGRLDTTGLALLSAGSTALVYGLSQLGTHPSFSAPTVLWPTLAGVSLTAAFIWHALRTERPLLDVRLYFNRVFGAASLTTFGLGAALFGAMILVPLYYQEVRHESVIVTGLLVGPQGLGMLIVMPLASRFTQRFGGGRVALFGVLVLSLSSIPLAFVTANSSIALISTVLLLRGAGIGLSFMPAMTAAFAALRPDQLSDATPQLNVLQRVGGAIGTAVLAVVLERATGHAPGQPASAFQDAYWWSVGICVLSLIPCLVLMRAENPRARLSREAANAEAGAEPLGV
jgi:EmrB/QacA subfamily drug resistance transporter